MKPKSLPIHLSLALALALFLVLPGTVGAQGPQAPTEFEGSTPEALLQVETLTTTPVVIIGGYTLDLGACAGSGPEANNMGRTSGGCLPVSGFPGLEDFAFTAMDHTAVSAASLALFDIAVLNVASTRMACNTANLTPQQKTDLLAFVAGGKKLIIFDSECPPQDYSWLPFPFTTANPGAMGAPGSLTIVEENTLSSNDIANPYYIDAYHLGRYTDAVGDMNVMTTYDPNWCVDMSGTNYLRVTGPVHTYAKYPAGTDVGLILYNGLDQDYQGYGINDPELRKMWLQELKQAVNPSNLPCGFTVVGITLAPPSAENNVGEDHTVTATLSDLLGNPQVGILVDFFVESGPNAGASGTCSNNADCTSDANGQVSFTYTGLGGVGTDEIKACFTDQGGHYLCSQLVTKDWLNNPPVADANGPYSVQEDMTITLDGTASYDPDGDLLTYEWDLDNDGIFETTGATPNFSRPDIGVYPVTLRVCDPFGACDTAAVDVYVTIEPGLFPPELTAYLIPGESFTEIKTVNVPPRPPNADVVFSFDLTGSMGGIIGTAKARAADIINELDALTGVDIQYGVMSYMDYPHSYNSCGYWAEYGTPYCSDYAYRLDQAVTGDASAVVSAINALVQGCGSDGPQDYTRIFYESYADPNVSWRTGAKRILVNFGDNVPHDCDLNEGVTPGVWSTGCDPGRDEIAGTGDDLDLQTVLGEMDGNGVVLLESHTTNWVEDHWTYWTGLTGGQLFLTGSGTLVDDVVAAVEDTLTAAMVYGLHLEAESPYESWLTTDPASMDVDPGMIGVSVDFEATFTVPPGTPPGEYTFTVYAVDENGVIYGEQQVTIIVLPPSTVTTSGLCTFDYAPTIDGQQFRLIFTPDMQIWPAYKLPASNPGQFYYNVFYAGEGPVDLDITIPAPFVTQGANPVHVYGGRTILPYGDTICFLPDYESELYAGDLAGLPDDLPGGFIYVAIHLDYGLKGTTGYIPNANNDALDAADGVTLLIPNLHDYIFSVSGSQNDSQTIQNVNDFKKIPGFGGLVLDGVNPLAGATVNIYLNGNLLGSAVTDEDGWYMLVYKHVGKSVPYTVELQGYGLNQSGELKANKFVEANFNIAP